LNIREGVDSGEGGEKAFTKGISLQQRLLIDGNAPIPSYASQIYRYAESTLGEMCLIS
jgi:hypothetical protein